ncbi:MAG: hypothetical protein JWM55_221 [Acidimicrobiaceae bacterium]|nr:hypothetical protein [Acidimicrobiaceae bacterium]
MRNRLRLLAAGGVVCLVTALPLAATIPSGATLPPVTCTWGQQGLTSPISNDNFAATNTDSAPPSYDSGTTDAWGNCTGLAGNDTFLITIMDTDGGAEVLQVYDDSIARGDGSAPFSAEPSWDMNDGTTYNSTNANPGRLDSASLTWFPDDATAEAHFGFYTGLAPGTAVVYDSTGTQQTVAATDTPDTDVPSDAGSSDSTTTTTTTTPPTTTTTLDATALIQSAGDSFPAGEGALIAASVLLPVIGLVISRIVKALKGNA